MFFIMIHISDLVDYPEGAKKLADLLIHCNLPEDKKLRDIVSSVQKHKHTQSCRKYGTNCRYGIPRLPTEETIIARPFHEMSDNEKQEILQGKSEDEFLKESTDYLTIAKEILDRKDLDVSKLTWETFFSMIGLPGSFEEQKKWYHRYLKVKQNIF